MVAASSEAPWKEHPSALLAELEADGDAFLLDPSLSGQWAEQLGLPQSGTLAERRRWLASHAAPPKCVQTAAGELLAALAGSPVVFVADRLSTAHLHPVPIGEAGGGEQQLARFLHALLGQEALVRPPGQAVPLGALGWPEGGAAFGVASNCEPASMSSAVLSLRAAQGAPQSREGEVLWLYAEAAARGELVYLRGQPDGLPEQLVRGVLDLCRSSGEKAGPDAGVRLGWIDRGQGPRAYVAEVLRPQARRAKLVSHRLRESGEVLARGLPASRGIAVGQVRRAQRPEEVQAGEVLVVDSLDPMWQEALHRAGAVVTRRGGRTSHAAVMAGEFGVPAVVGVGEGCDALEDGQEVTVASPEGEDEGAVYRGRLAHDAVDMDLDNLPPLPTAIRLNIGNPDRVFSLAAVPNDGIGLARLEFLISRLIGVHPMAAAQVESLEAGERAEVERALGGVSGSDACQDAYVRLLAQGIARLCAAVEPNPVVLRFSDFRSDEYRALLGGERFELHELNPALGLRGAARYLLPRYEAALDLECRAVRAVREMGFGNLETVVPFVRTPEEGAAVLAKLQSCGISRDGPDAVKVHLMAEVPSNLVLVDEFLQLFDGLLLGTNDLTQLVLGVDRSSSAVAHLYLENHPAILRLVEPAMQACKAAGKEFGVCGRAVGTDHELARWFVQRGADSLSVESSRALSLRAWLMNAGGQ